MQVVQATEHGWCERACQWEKDAQEGRDHADVEVERKA